MLRNIYFYMLLTSLTAMLVAAIVYPSSVALPLVGMMAFITLVLLVVACRSVVKTFEDRLIMLDLAYFTRGMGAQPANGSVSPLITARPYFRLVTLGLVMLVVATGATMAGISGLGGIISIGFTILVMTGWYAFAEVRDQLDGTGHRYFIRRA